MSTKLLSTGKLIIPSRTGSPILSSPFQKHFRNFTTSWTMAAVVDADFIRRISAAEKAITKKDDPVKRGPTAKAQRHIGQRLTSQVLHDITMGERFITGKEAPVSGGPTAIAQRSLLQTFGASIGDAKSHSGVLDSEKIAKTARKEKEITGSEDPVRRGPTARAQQHAGESINSQTLHDITEGEKKITGGERVKGGPTSAAQSELAKSRS